MPSQSSTSTPSGASSIAARSRLVFSDSARRLPLTARIFMSAFLPHERQLGDQLDVRREVVAPALVRGVPVDAVLRAVDVGLEPQPEPLPAEGIGRRSVRDRAGQVDRARDALDRELAVRLHGLALALPEVRGPKLDLGVAGGVEEVRGLEMAVQLLVLHVDGGDLRGPREGVPAEGRLEVAEAAAERVHARVADLERDVRVDG